MFEGESSCFARREGWHDWGNKRAQRWNHQTLLYEKLDSFIATCHTVYSYEGACKLSTEEFVSFECSQKEPEEVSSWSITDCGLQTEYKPGWRRKWRRGREWREWYAVEIIRKLRSRSNRHIAEMDPFYR